MHATTPSGRDRGDRDGDDGVTPVLSAIDPLVYLQTNVAKLVLATALGMFLGLERGGLKNPQVSERSR